MQSVLLTLHIIDVFLMSALFRRTFFFNEQETKYVSIYLNGDLKLTSSVHVVLNEMLWFIPVTFNNNILKNEVHELGDRRNLSMYCGRCIRVPNASRVKTFKCF